MFKERDSIRKNSIALGTFALVTAVLLSSTHTSTKERIADAQREVEQKALLEIIPLERHSNDLLLDLVDIPERYWPTLGLTTGSAINVARDPQGNPIAVILPAVAPDGYSGALKMIVGINIDGTIAGVRITEHKETPGLGDKVDLKRSDWVLNFGGKSLHNPSINQWKVKKDKGAFDQFTGATITPRAVVNQVARTLQYFEEDKARILKAAIRARQPESPQPKESPQQEESLQSKESLQPIESPDQDESASNDQQ